MNILGVDYCYVRPDYKLKLNKNQYEDLELSLGALDTFENQFNLDVFYNEKRIF